MTEGERDHFDSYHYGLVCIRVQLESEREGKTLSLREVVERADKIMAGEGEC
jgi:hypothetical protein